MTSSHQPGDSFPLGTTTVTYYAEDAAKNLAVASFDITVGGIGLWRQETFGAQKDNPEIAGDLANPDGDRWPNIAEYVFGTDPLAIDGRHLTSITTKGAELMFDFTHVDQVPDVALVVERCTSPREPWTAVAVRMPSGAWVPMVPGVDLASSQEGEYREVRLTKPTGGAHELIRLTMRMATVE